MTPTNPKSTLRCELWRDEPETPETVGPLDPRRGLAPLPASLSRPGLPRARPDGSARDPQRQPLRVLLVDDDRTAASRLERALRDSGLCVRRLTRGKAALAAAFEDPPDLAVLSLELPDITGFEASRWLRDDVRTRQLPIVLLSDSDDRQTRTAAYAAGADSVLTRPVGAEELLAVAFSLGARREHARVEPSSASVAALLVALELHGSDARAHGLRVARLARQVGPRLGLRPAALRTLTLAAELHDIGVLALPPTLVARRGPLDAEQRAVAQQHAELGARILAPLASLDDVRHVIRHHHERWDGAGQPEGLAGAAIPALARLLAVLDRFDSLCFGRHARPPLEPEAALRVLRDDTRRGCFDPNVVDAFDHALRSGRVRVEHGARTR